MAAPRGIKLIRHNANQVDEPDDPSMPYRYEGDFTPPEFMQVTFVLLYGGSEEIIIRATSLRKLNKYLDEAGLKRHPRLRSFTITGPDGVIEEYKR